MANTYISSDDITDNIVVGFDISPYINEANLEMQDLAESKGIYNTDDLLSPIAYKVRRYLICFICMRICQDKMGTNNIDLPELEKYKMKYDMYKKEKDNLYDYITYEMLTGDITELRERTVNSAIIFRG